MGPKGTLVHAALEKLFADVPPEQRSVEEGLAQLERAWAELRNTPDFADLGLDGPAEAEWLEDAATLVANYFRLEDPCTVRAIGLELKLEARLGTLALRGVIDRLDLDEHGGLVVTDYKTGRAPGVAYENGRLGGVQFYAFLCEQLFGRRPVRIQLLHLREPVAISAVPTEQSVRGFQGRTSAIWSAVEKACVQEDFRPRPSPLCGYCAFKTWCPSFGGDPALARADLLAVVAG
ncbi:MAG: RecB family exonuclease [Acidimicrobiales bacterium]